MDKQKVARATLLEMLISETTRALGRDANFLGSKIEIRRRNDGDDPNWDANIGIAAPFVLRAFAAALRELHLRYDLDETETLHR